MLYSCSPSVTANDCTTLDDTGGSSINALAYANGRLYEALNSGVLWECDPTVAALCETLDTAGAPITSLISAANGSLYAGVPEVSGNPQSGFVWQCSATQANSCTAAHDGRRRHTTALREQRALLRDRRLRVPVQVCGERARKLPAARRGLGQQAVHQRAGRRSGNRVIITEPSQSSQPNVYDCRVPPSRS